MKSVYKLLIDIGPLAVFFIFYTRSGLQASILPFMLATVISVIFSYILEKKILLTVQYLLKVYKKTSYYSSKVSIDLAKFLALKTERSSGFSPRPT